MAKSLYASANGLARKVKKMYLGIEGVARKIKKGYVGVNGLARLFFSGASTLSKANESIGPLSAAMRQHKAAYVAGYALVGGGWTINNWRNLAVNVYDNALEQQELELYPGGSSGGYQSSAASNSAYGLIATVSSGTQDYSATTAFDSDLSGQKLNRGLQAAGAGVNGHNVAWGGGGEGGGSPYGRVMTFDTSLTMDSVTDRPGFYRMSRQNLAGAKAGSYAVFTGGEAGSNTMTRGKMADAYTEELVATPLPDLPTVVYDHVGVTMGNMAVFAGGYNYNDSIDHVFVYDENLTSIECPNLPHDARWLAGEATEDIAVFAGGQDNTSAFSIPYVVFMDTELTMHSAENLSQSRRHANVAICGANVLVSGGQGDSSRAINSVELYEIA